MDTQQIDKLDKLREEKRGLEYFRSGNGTFGIKKKEYTLTKFFGCGTHELSLEKEIATKVEGLLLSRLEEINKQIAEL